MPAFDHIPKDLPMLGLVATLDPWYMANSMAREFLPATDIPTMVASVREVEHLVGIGQRRSVSGVLSEIMRPDDERRTWELGTACRRSMSRTTAIHCSIRRGPVCRSTTQRGKDESSLGGEGL